jgi:hypothetical protein
MLKELFDNSGLELCFCFGFLAMLVFDFGPKITIKIVESLREDIGAGKLKSGSEIKVLVTLFVIT